MHRSVTGNDRVDAAGRKACSASLDKAEFETLYRQSRSALWCIAVSVLGDRSHAEDIVQEAALIAYTRRDRFTPGTSFLAWTGRIVRNVALNARRKKGRQGKSMIDVAENAVTHRNGVAGASERIPLTERGELKPEQQAFDDAVVAALMQLSPEARACLLLRTVLEFSYAEIAEALDMPLGTAMSHVYRARKLMRTFVLNDNDDDNRFRSTRKS